MAVHKFKPRNEEQANKDLKKQWQQNIIARSDEVRSKLSNLRKDVKDRFPGLAGIVDNLKIEDKGSSVHGGVAATDGKNIEVNAERILALGDDAAKIIAHELLHIQRDDAAKYAGDATISTSVGEISVGNIVADAQVNNEVGGIKDGIDIENAKDMDEQRLYDVISSSLQDPQVEKADFWAAVKGDRQKWNEMVKHYKEKKEREERGEEQDREQESAQEQEAERKAEQRAERTPPPPQLTPEEMGSHF